MIVPPPRTLVLPPGRDKTRRPGRSRPLVTAVACVLIAAGWGCGRARPTDEEPDVLRLPVDVFADTARDVRLGSADSMLAFEPPPPETTRAPLASVWLARVSPAPPVHVDPSMAGAEPQAGEWPEPPKLDVDEGLKAPIPRGSSRLVVPRGSDPGWVELDVRVDETGAVSDVEWAGGAIDSARVEAATACAFAMQYFPALQDGRAVAVWCRQRFDFGR